MVTGRCSHPAHTQSSSALGNTPPVEHEQRHVAPLAANPGFGESCHAVTVSVETSVNKGSVDRGDELNAHWSDPHPTVLTRGESSQQHLCRREEGEPVADHDLEGRTGASAAPSDAVGVEGAIVRTEVLGQVGVITLDDERRRNALSAQMANGIVAALEGLQAMDVRAVVLRAAAGLQVWSAGQDIDELPRGRRDPMTYNDPLEQLLRAIRTFPAPVIAMVHGSVWGGAFDLVLSCDVLIADETATFAITPANLGLPYNTTGLLHFLGRLPINLTKELFFTARPLDAQRAKEWLVLNHLVGSAELESVTLDLAATIASKSPLAIGVIKEQLRVLADFQPIAAQVYERIQGLRREVYDSGDYLEGLTAFAEKRKPIFKGT